jgi:hypothetical protein
MRENNLEGRNAALLRELHRHSDLRCERAICADDRCPWPSKISHRQPLGCTGTTIQGGGPRLPNFGTWSVSENDKTVTRHYEGALLPNYEGTESKMSVSIAGDELTLLDPNPDAGLGQGRFVTVYRRVSSQPLTPERFALP